MAQRALTPDQWGDSITERTTRRCDRLSRMALHQREKLTDGGRRTNGMSPWQEGHAQKMFLSRNQKYCWLITGKPWTRSRRHFDRRERSGFRRVGTVRSAAACRRCRYGSLLPVVHAARNINCLCRKDAKAQSFAWGAPCASIPVLLSFRPQGEIRFWNGMKWGRSQYNRHVDSV